MAVENLIWQFAFFPLWALFGSVFFVALTGCERFWRFRLPESAGTALVVASACLALMALLWADCAVLLDFPFSERVCRLVGF